MLLLCLFLLAELFFSRSGSSGNVKGHEGVLGLLLLGERTSELLGQFVEEVISRFLDLSARLEHILVGQNLEVLRILQLVVEGSVLLLGEVEDEVPLVCFGDHCSAVVLEVSDDFSELGVLPEERVFPVEGADGQPVGALDDWIVGSVKVDLGVDQVSASELST